MNKAGLPFILSATCIFKGIDVVVFVYVDELLIMRIYMKSLVALKKGLAQRLSLSDSGDTGDYLDTNIV